MPKVAKKKESCTYCRICGRTLVGDRCPSVVHNWKGMEQDLIARVRESLATYPEDSSNEVLRLQIDKIKRQLEQLEAKHGKKN